MKNKAILKNFIIEIKHSLSRFFSILLIVALGVAFFSGIRAAKPDMQISADKFYDDSNLLDIRVLSTLGLTDEDVEAIQQVDGVAEAEPAYSMDVLCDTDSSQMVIKLLSRTDQLNRIQLIDGRLPDKTTECLVDKQFIQQSGYKIGDTITLHLEENEDILDSLSNNQFTIVGIGSSSYYLSLDRGTSSIGNGKINSFIVVTPDTFKTEAYSEIYISASGSKALTSYTDDYDELVDSVTDRIEDIADSRKEARYEQVLKEPRTDIEEAKAKLAKEESKAKKELEDAAIKLALAKTEIADGEKAIAKGKEKIRDGRAELAENKETLRNSQDEIRQGLEKLVQGNETLKNGKILLQEKQAEYETGLQSITGGYAKWNDSYSQWENQYTSLLDNEAKINSALDELHSKKAELEPVKDLYPDQWQQLLQSEQELNTQKENLEVGRLQLEQAKTQLDDTKATLDQEQAKLDEAKVLLEEESKKIEASELSIKENYEKLKESQKKIDDAWDEIAKGETKLKDSEALLIDKEAQLNDGKKILAENEKKYEDAVITADKKIEDAKEKIADAEEKLNKLKYPKWYVLDRNSIQTYVEYGQDAQRIGNIGEVFPAIFFLVAALVSLTTMTRMVEEERTQIGTLKALGYNKSTIAGKYIMYGMIATFIGSILGIVIGEKILPSVIISSYQILYDNLPDPIVPYNVYYGALSIIIAVATTTLATLLACYKELLSQPSQLMRPASPKLGKRVILERIPWLWKKFNFTTKATIRNLLRYKKRFFMTVFGIGSCMALLLVGFGLKDSIGAMSDIQYVELWHQDSILTLDTESDAADQKELNQYLDTNDKIKDYIRAKETSIDAGNGKKKKSVNLFVPENELQLKEYINLRDRVTHDEYDLQDGSVIISEKLASLLHINIGDTIYLSDKETNQVEVKVSAIVENYMMHYVFMTSKTYETLFGTLTEYNKLYLKNTQLTKADEDRLTSEILELKAVTSVLYTSELQHRIDDMLTSLNTVIYVLIISAGLLAFVVLFNLNNININERQRELATLKVLGFQDMEVATYVYRENVMLTVIGAIVGVCLGLLLHRYVILTAEIDMIMFGRKIKVLSFIYSILLTFGFSAFVNFVMYYRLRKIDMVESLKSIE